MIGTVDIVKYGMFAAGVFIMISSFLYHSYRKLTVNLAVVWEIIGVILIVAGVFPVLSSWTRLISKGIGLALFFLGAVCLWGGFQLSILLSCLMMKNHELAMQVSILLQENESIMQQLKEQADRMREYEEKTSVRD